MYQMCKHIRLSSCGLEVNTAYTGKSFADKADNRLETPSAHTNLPRHDHFEELDVSVPAQVQRLN